MPSINRSLYVSGQQRGALPGPRDVMATGPGSRAFVHFDPAAGGLQRRVGKPWPLDTHMLRQGCQPTGRNIGPPGFEQPEYDCPFPIAGQPVWSQPGRARETVFGDIPRTLAMGSLGFYVAVGLVLGGVYILWRRSEA